MSDIDLLAAHEVFAELGSENFSRCMRSVIRFARLMRLFLISICRKAALCYINAGDYASAQDLMSQCPQGEASSQYLNFLSAVKQGPYSYPLLTSLKLIR